METSDNLPPEFWEGNEKQKVEIRVKGQIDENWSEWFQGFDIRSGKQGESIMTGEIKDQADLYGVIAKLRDLGMNLRAVNIVS